MQHCTNVTQVKLKLLMVKKNKIKMYICFDAGKLYSRGRSVRIKDNPLQAMSGISLENFECLQKLISIQTDQVDN